MASMITQKNIGALIDIKPLTTSLSWTAGGASDAVTWTGVTIDRQAFSNGSMPRTMDAAVFWDAKIGVSGSSLSLSIQVQDSPDGTNWSDYATEASAIVTTVASGAGRYQGITRLVMSNADDPAVAFTVNAGGLTQSPGISLNAARRYIRMNFVPDFSGAGTDTGVAVGIGVFAGFDTLNAPIG